LIDWKWLDAVDPERTLAVCVVLGENDAWDVHGNAAGSPSSGLDSGGLPTPDSLTNVNSGGQRWTGLGVS
jgi:hypothetical protein